MKASQRNLGDGTEPMRMRLLWVMVLLMLTACLAATGCRTAEDEPKADPTIEPPMQAMGLEVRPDDAQVVAGETVVLTAHADESILYRGDARVEWDAPEGEVSIASPNRIARVRYEQPGSYRVTARLMVGGEEVASDVTSIRVRAVE